MAAPSYHATSMLASADPAQALQNLVEVDLAAAGWQFVEEYNYTAASTARLQRVWKNPATLNAAGVDFYIALARNAFPSTYFSIRAAETWNTSTKVFGKPCLLGSTVSGNQTPAAFLTYANNLYFAFTSSGQTVSISSDGVNWKASGNLPVAGSWRQVAYGNSTYVTVSGASGTNAATSTDGLTWTQRTLPSTNTWTGVAYGNGVFVAVNASSSSPATSPDGITWTTRAGGIWNAVTYGAGVFVAVGNSVCATSPDGINWTSRTIAAGTWMNVIYAGGQFVATGNSICATSPDGTTWTARTIGSGTFGSSTLAYGNGKYVAVSQNTSVVFYSSDAISWSNTTIAATGVTSLNTVAFGAGTFVAATNTAYGLPSAVVSTDGTTWTASGLYHTPSTTTTWAPSGGTPTMVDPGAYLTSLTTTNAYDVSILASKSYLALAVNRVGTGSQVFALVAGLYQPAYSDSQATNPPLMVLALDATITNGVPSSGGGVARTLRSTTDLYPYAITAAPESLPRGQVTSAGAKTEPATGTITGSKVALLGGGNPLNTGVGLRGWLYDAIAVGIPGGAGAIPKLDDTVRAGTTTYYCLGQSAVGGGWYAGKDSVGYFFDVTAGS